MKTIEEKAKAYDEALERAKTLYENANGMILKKWVEQVFPELAESEDERIRKGIFKALSKKDARDVLISQGIEVSDALAWLEKQAEKKLADKVEPKFKVGEKELTNEELCEGLIRGMVNEHNRVTKEVLRNEYEKGRADVLAKIDAIDVDEMVCESGATSRVTQYWYAHGVNDVIKKLKEE